MLVAIYSEIFSDAEPVRQDKKIFEVFANVFSRDWRDSGCLGSYIFGISIKVGTKILHLHKTWMKLSSPWNNSAYFDISSKEPPLSEDSMMGRMALS